MVETRARLEVAGVTKSVAGDVWLHGVDLELGVGLNVLVGPTTAGKTSLMRIIAGLERPTTGRIILDGVDVTGVHVRHRDVAFVYQEFVNYPSFTVRKNIAAPLTQGTDLGPSEIEERVAEVAALMKLEPYLERLPEELSGGQQQRVAIARALVKRSRLLILDEPLANLDYKLREGLREELQRVFAERDAIVVYSTTEPTEALILGGHTVVMDQGRILQSGDAVGGYHRPTSAQVARVYSDPPMNLLAATVSTSGVALDGLTSAGLPPHFRGRVEGAVDVGIRPHTFRMRAVSSDEPVHLRGTIALAEVTGSDTFLHVALPTGDRVVAQLVGVHPHEVGEEVELFAGTESLFAFSRDDGTLMAAPVDEPHGVIDG